MLDLSGLDDAFPGLLAKFPIVRDRNYYRPPLRKDASKHQQQGGLLTAGSALTGEGAAQDFWGGVSTLLTGAVGQEGQAAIVTQLKTLYGEHVRGLNLEEVEELATALLAKQP